MGCFGNFNSSDHSCRGCMVTVSCRHERLRKYLDTRKVFQQRNRTEFLKKMQSKLFSMLSLSISPVSTTKIVSQVIAWNTRPTTGETRLLLRQMAKLGDLVCLSQGNGRYYLTRQNYERYIAK